MAQRYVFSTVWHIDAPAQVVSEALIREADWTTWWQGLEQANVQNHRLGEGSVVATTWRSQAGYRLHFTLTITTFRPGDYIAFTATGDLEGDGDFILEPDGDATTITIDWRVHTTKVWMNVLAPLLRPLFSRNHNLLMRAGEKGLKAYVADQINRLQ
jgi:uncharacterized protein YndB with AHSA1/START domain